MAESSLVGSCAQALQEQLSSWAGHQLEVLPAPGEQWASWVRGTRHRRPWNASGAGSHRSSLRGDWWVAMGRAPAGEQGPSRGVGLGLQPRAHSREGRGEWNRGWSSPAQGCVRSIPAPTLSCQAAREQPGCSRPLPIPASAWLCPPCCMAQGQEVHAASPSQGS